MRPHDVRTCGAANLAAQLEVAPFAAGTMVEHSKFDPMSAFGELACHLRNEHSEVGIGRPGIHLRDAEDVH